jgi:hypothetical protein
MSEATKVPKATKEKKNTPLTAPIPKKNRKDRTVCVFPF